MSETIDSSKFTGKDWMNLVKPYCNPETRRSFTQLTGTLIAFFSLWSLCWWSMQVSYVLTLVLTIPTAAFLDRLFMIQHDCGHGSYFKNRRLQNAVGFCLGVLTITPYHYWKKTHAMHHSHSGNLESGGEGEIVTITKEAYLKLSKWEQLKYRLYRHPISLLALGSAFQFGLKHRFPWDTPKSWKQEWASVWGTNLCLAIILIVATFTIGLQTFLMIQIPVSILASAMGIFLFYVQHQYEDAYFKRPPDWDYYDAALKGSSHLNLPAPLQWLSASIGLHHIHHLNHNIPNYKLAEAHVNHPELKSPNIIELKDTPKLLSLSLWDEEAQKLISFNAL
jgi:omega-6 fatty acid desaturase (delta-12 desaturase)